MAAKKKKQAVVVEERAYSIVNDGEPGFLTSVMSNIKGGVSVKLGACTAVVSTSNRAGKTAVLDSIRYALTGQHPIGPHYADLCGLTADGSAPWATLTGANGEKVASSSVPSGKKSVAHDDDLRLSDVQRAAMLPMSSVRDLLSLGTAKAREEVFRRFGGDLDAIPVPVGLDDDQLELWEEITNATKRSDPSEWLAAAGEEIRRRKRSLSSDAKSLEEEKSRLADQIGDAGDPTDEIAALEKRVIAAEKAQTFANILKSYDEVKQQLNDEIEAFTNTLKPLTTEEFDQRPQLAERATAIGEVGLRVAALKQSHQANLGRLTNGQRILTLRKHLDGGCIVCGSEEPPAEKKKELIDTMQELVSVLESELMPVQAEIEALQAEEKKLIAQNAMLTAKEEMAWKESVRDYEAQQNRLTMLGNHYKRLFDAIQVAGVTDAEDVDKLGSLRDRLNALRLVTQGRERINDLKGKIRRVEYQQADAKEVESAISDSLNKLLEKIKNKAEGAVNGWMPEGFKAALRLEDTEGKPVCRWEVVGRDGVSHPRNCASGAEWSALTVALACAWVEDCPYKFVLLDDADIGGFSAANVEHVLHTLQQAVAKGRLTQVFVAWSRPDEIPRNGWTVTSP